MNHELGLQFNSPTVNIWFKSSEFIKFFVWVEYYLYDCEIEMDVQRSVECGYLVVRLDDIHVYFIHYESFEQAKKMRRATETFGYGQSLYCHGGKRWL